MMWTTDAAMLAAGLALILSAVLGVACWWEARVR